MCLLHTAATAGDIQLITSLVADGLAINAVDSTTQQSSLIHAIVAGHIEAAQTLIALGADVNQLGLDDKTGELHSPLYFAFTSVITHAALFAQLIQFSNDREHQKIFPFIEDYKHALNTAQEISFDLLKAGAIPQDITPENINILLSSCTLHNDLDSVKKLVLEYHADPLAQPFAIHEAVTADKADILHFFLDQIDSAEYNTNQILYETLNAATIAGNISAVESLLDLGICIKNNNNFPGNPLWYAMIFTPDDKEYAPHFEIAELLIKHGADVEALRHFIENPQGGYNNQSSLLWKTDSAALIKETINWFNAHSDSPIHVNLQKDTGETALHHAIKHHAVDMVKVLLELGADSSIVNNEGKSSIHYAQQYGNEEIVSLFQAEITALEKVASWGIWDMFSNVFSNFMQPAKTQETLKIQDIIDNHTAVDNLSGLLESHTDNITSVNATHPMIITPMMPHPEITHQNETII